MTWCICIMTKSTIPGTNIEVSDVLFPILREHGIQYSAAFEHDREVSLSNSLVVDISDSYCRGSSSTPMCLMCDEYINGVELVGPPPNHRYHSSIAQGIFSTLLDVLCEFDKLIAHKIAVNILVGEDIVNLSEFSVINCSAQSMVDKLLHEIDHEGCVMRDYHFVLIG